MASDRRTRLKILLDEHFLAIVLVLAVVAAGGAWATYTTAAAPGTHVEQRDVASWGVTGGFNHSAAVVNETPISERGAVRAGQHFTSRTRCRCWTADFGFRSWDRSKTRW